VTFYEKVCAVKTADISD